MHGSACGYDHFVLKVSSIPDLGVVFHLEEVCWVQVNIHLLNRLLQICLLLSYSSWKPFSIHWLRHGHKDLTLLPPITQMFGPVQLMLVS